MSSKFKNVNLGPKNYGKIQSKIDTPKIDTPKIDASFEHYHNAPIFGERLYIKSIQDQS